MSNGSDSDDSSTATTYYDANTTGDTTASVVAHDITFIKDVTKYNSQSASSQKSINIRMNEQSTTTATTRTISTTTYTNSICNKNNKIKFYIRNQQISMDKLLFSFESHFIVQVLHLLLPSLLPMMITTMTTTLTGHLNYSYGL
jgi:hypothetical protein